MKKYNSSTGCYKIDLFYKGVYLCSTEQSKTCKAAKERYQSVNGKFDEKLTAHFFKY